LVVGIIFLIIGGIIFFEGYNQVKEYQSTLGQIGRAVSESAREEYNTYKLMEEFGGIMLLVGFVVSIAGTVSSPKEKND